MKHRTDYSGDELQTEKYWEKRGLVPRAGEEGLALWTNRFHAVCCTYYTKEQLRPMSDEEKLLADEIKKEKNREQYRRRRQREREREEELRRQRKAEMRRREEIGAY